MRGNDYHGVIPAERSESRNPLQSEKDSRLRGNDMEGWKGFPLARE
ncbi:hypothetical protein Cabys_2739 [Caldithrix abyssi DSM 13497]|uniref:Uncharacterized protein n=1 Tax=Caldithrix abyssi DSM 13497 TaxID=880073 RepID=A0A1J1CA00_CALAY|nr:hypothetical protein Cabys_2738 [Caldithrix abyssi DSM 13497]APF19487.1 hypothetical protein Cabys_2739 [Caldithrix abyssi DSM 13497]